MFPRKTVILRTLSIITLQDCLIKNIEFKKEKGNCAFILVFLYLGPFIIITNHNQIKKVSKKYPKFLEITYCVYE